VTVSSADLGTYLGFAVDTTRATLILANATALCLSIIDPLPVGADAVILDVAARAYGNPANVQQQTVGPYSANYGPAGGGLWLTRSNKATLRRLGGGGGAFMIETMPATAGQGLPWWDAGVVVYDDFDSEQL
jgi:hypothetical protein